VPFVVPFTTIETPGIGSPASALTCPVMLFSCANEKVCAKTKNISVKKSFVFNNKLFPLSQSLLRNFLIN